MTVFGETVGTAVRMGPPYPSRAEKALAEGPLDTTYRQHFNKRVAVLYPGNLPEKEWSVAQRWGSKGAPQSFVDINYFK